MSRSKPEFRPRNVIRYFDIRNASLLSGLSVNQVRNLARRGLVPSERSPDNSYRLSFKSLVILRNIKRLMDEGISMRRVLPILAELRTQMPKAESFAGVRLSAIGGRVLVEDQHGVWDARTRQSEILFEPYYVPKPIPMRSVSVRGAVMGKTFDNFTSDDWYNYGIELEENDDSEARGAYKRAIELDSTNFDAQINLGRLFQLDGNLNEAHKCYQLALEVDPGNQTANFNMGTVLDEWGNYEDATEHYLLAPSIADAHYCLWIIYDSKGESEKARKHMSIYAQMTRNPE